jgi:hypothetical protein
MVGDIYKSMSENKLMFDMSAKCCIVRTAPACAIEIKSYE